MKKWVKNSFGDDINNLKPNESQKLPKIPPLQRRQALNSLYFKVNLG